MSIIKAALSSVSSVTSDQWKEFFICNSIPNDLVMIRGFKSASSGGANKGSEDVITDGSLIAVADGQWAIVVSSGKVISIYKEPGEHLFSSGASPSIFGGSSLKSVGSEIGRRITFGGDIPAKVQKVYYLNTKEITGNEFENKKGIPFRIQDERSGVDIDCTLTMSGIYSFRIFDPKIIYRKMIGNVKQVYTVSYLKSVVDPEVNNAITQAVGDLGNDPNEKLRASQLPSLLPQLTQMVKDRVNERIRASRGIELVSLGFSTFTLTENDTGTIREMQFAAALTDPQLRTANLAGATAEAMKDAACNPAGGGTIGLFALNASQNTAIPAENTQAVKKYNFCPECGSKIQGGRFCRECGFKLYDHIT